MFFLMISTQQLQSSFKAVLEQFQSNLEISLEYHALPSKWNLEKNCFVSFFFHYLTSTGLKMYSIITNWRIC